MIRAPSNTHLHAACRAPSSTMIPRHHSSFSSLALLLQRQWRVFARDVAVPWVSVCVLFGSIFMAQSSAVATPSDSPDVLARRGKVIGGSGTAQPTLVLNKPEGGWTSAVQAEIAGTCSDQTADPIEVNVNGTRYYVRSVSGAFSRKFPLAPGKNTIIVECRNAAGVGRATAVLDAVVSAIPLKFVLTSDTDGVYTDLHIYEPDGHHVYWASTHSPTGGIFFLNEQNGSFDQPGYGPYLYVHTNPPPGVYRIDTNYWPGAAIQHTLASLDVVVNEGTPAEFHRRVQRPLARPDETQTLAYVVFRPNQLAPLIFVPGQDSPEAMPAEVAEYQKTIEPTIKKDHGSDDLAFFAPADEAAMRSAITGIALAQARRPSPLWEVAQRDCAGLVRFAFREALRERSDDQLRTLGLPKRLLVPEVSFAARRQFPFYPNIWEIGLESLPPTKRYGAFADAETLTSFNFRLKSRALADARPGDLLVYRRDFAGAEPYHLMMYAGGRPRPVVVYHTGVSTSETPVRVVALDELVHAADASWLPLAENPYFLGIYEWKKFRHQLA